MDYHTILSKLTTSWVPQTVWSILSHYREHTSTVVNYLYGANIAKYRLLESYHHPYKQALIDGDFLLPDGIALRTLWRIRNKTGIISGPSMIHNLNGTDLIDWILTDMCTNHSHIHISVYCNFDPTLGLEPGQLIQGAQNYLHTHYNLSLGYAVDKAYSWPDTRSRSDYDQSIAYHTGPKIVLVCTGTPQQEIRIAQHRQMRADRGCLVLAQGGTLDFWAGIEPRAPKLIRKLHLEFVYRLIVNPRKNWKKVLISLTIIWLIIKGVAVYRYRGDHRHNSLS